MIENKTDTQRALASHVSGEQYIVESCSIWEGDDCVGSRIIAATGPIQQRDLGEGPLEPSAQLFDRINAWQGLSGEDADWLQAEEDAGRLTYPIGAR